MCCGQRDKAASGWEKTEWLGLLLPPFPPSFLSVVLRWTEVTKVHHEWVLASRGSHRRGKGRVLLEAFAVFSTDPETQLVRITWGNTQDSQSLAPKETLEGISLMLGESHIGLGPRPGPLLPRKISLATYAEMGTLVHTPERDELTFKWNGTT